jgi:hypothetical protein
LAFNLLWFSLGWLAAKHQTALVKWRLPIWIVGIPVGLALMLPHMPDTALWGMLAAIGYACLSTAIIYPLRKLRVLQQLGARTMEIYVAQFFFVQFVFIRSPWNAAITFVLAVAGSLAIGQLARLNPLTNAILLGGRSVKPSAAKEKAVAPRKKGRPKAKAAA